MYKQLFVNVSFVYICNYMSMYLWSLVSCQAAFISGLHSRAVEEEERERERGDHADAFKYPRVKP